MTDITPYQQRLEWLREWMDIVIFETREYNRGIYARSWIMEWYKTIHPGYLDCPSTFNQYCKHKQSLCQYPNT